MRTKRILVVDDELALLTSIKALLEYYGYSVSAANNVYAALDILGDSDFDLIVCDYNMPKINGVDFYKIFRTNLFYNGDYAKTPVLFISGVVSANNIPLKFDIERARFLGKPFKVEEFLELVKEMIEEAEEESEAMPGPQYAIAGVKP